MWKNEKKKIKNEMHYEENEKNALAVVSTRF